MKNIGFYLLLLSLSSISAFASTERIRYPMPEPSALAELATCAVGLGAYAWHRAKKSF
jgi:hypothetical protein